MTENILALENQLCFAVVTAARNVVSIYRPVLEPLGLTHPQYLVSARPVGEIAALTRGARRRSWRWSRRHSRPSSSGSRLRAGYLVARRADDERVLDISLTDEGRALRREALNVPRRIMERVGMDAAEVGQLREALVRFAGRAGVPAAP